MKKKGAKQDSVSVPYLFHFDVSLDIVDKPTGLCLQWTPHTVHVYFPLEEKGTRAHLVI